MLAPVGACVHVHSDEHRGFGVQGVAACHAGDEGGADAEATGFDFPWSGGLGGGFGVVQGAVFLAYPVLGDRGRATVAVVFNAEGATGTRGVDDGFVDDGVAGAIVWPLMFDGTVQQVVDEAGEAFIGGRAAVAILFGPLAQECLELGVGHPSRRQVPVRVQRLHAQSPESVEALVLAGCVAADCGAALVGHAYRGQLLECEGTDGVHRAAQAVGQARQEPHQERDEHRGAGVADAGTSTTRVHALLVVVVNLLCSRRFDDRIQGGGEDGI
jgi:hypothetical protein